MKKIIFGALYRANNRLGLACPRYNDRSNDQKTNLWIPVRVAYFDEVKKKNIDKIYMIDTYQLDVPYEFREFDKLVPWLKELAEAKDHRYIMHRAYDYYYTALVEITSQTVEAFDLVGILENYKTVSEKETRYYGSENYMGKVYLSNYHKDYNKPFYLIEKSASIIHSFKINRLVDDALYGVQRPYLDTWRYNQVMQAVENAEAINAAYDKSRVQYLKLLKEKLDELYQEYEKYTKDLKKEMKLENE